MKREEENRQKQALLARLEAEQKKANEKKKPKPKKPLKYGADGAIKVSSILDR